MDVVDPQNVLLKTSKASYRTYKHFDRKTWVGRALVVLCSNPVGINKVTVTVNPCSKHPRYKHIFVLSLLYCSSLSRGRSYSMAEKYLRYKHKFAITEQKSLLLYFSPSSVSFLSSYLY